MKPMSDEKEISGSGYSRSSDRPGATWGSLRIVHDMDPDEPRTTVWSDEPGGWVMVAVTDSDGRLTWFGKPVLISPGNSLRFTSGGVKITGI
jgi:hypothetical protein